MTSAQIRYLSSIDPRVKLVYLAISTMSVFFIQSRIVLLLLGGVVIWTLLCVPSHQRPTRPAVVSTCILLLFVILVSSFGTKEHLDVVIYSSFGFALSGFLQGLTTALRIMCVVGLSYIFSATTSTTQTLAAFQWMCAPLRRMGVHTNDFTMMLALSLRFAPLLSQGLETRAQLLRCRGITPQGGIINTIKFWGKVFVNAIVDLFRRSEPVADSMLLRGYNDAYHLELPPFGIKNTLVVIAGIMICVACAIVF